MSFHQCVHAICTDPRENMCPIGNMCCDFDWERTRACRRAIFPAADSLVSQNAEMTCCEIATHQGRALSHGRTADERHSRAHTGMFPGKNLGVHRDHVAADRVQLLVPQHNLGCLDGRGKDAVGRLLAHADSACRRTGDA